MSGRLTECPHCGSKDSFRYAEYGCIINYTGTFRDGNIEHTDIGYTRPPAIWAKCDACDRRIRLDSLRTDR